MMLHCTKRCGRAGAALRWFTAHNRLTTLRAWIWMTRLRDYLRGLSSVRFPRRPRRRNDAVLHEAARGRGREVVRRAHPVDDTERLDLGVDTTARLPRGAVKPSVPPRRPGQRNDVAPQGTCGRAGTGVRWFAAYDRLTTLSA